MQSISEIKAILAAADPKALPEALEPFRSDGREGVKKLVVSAEKRIAAYEKELARMEEMFHYERLYPEAAYIGGIDEVGRGPLAGPVVACCVVLPKDCDILYLNDSKQVPEKKREELYDEIMAKAVSVGIGMVSHEVIDDINILQATYEAMRQAIGKLTVTPQHLLVDAVHIPGISIPQRGIIKGDAKSASIAAASIVAKVTRDRLMTELDAKYPQYGFARNKGYGAPEHLAALRQYGPCEIHRMSFLGGILGERE
ncbi:MAG: ribonuclease HII [Lachnospiraceae bacterium]|nr:ribonuclease HII [Lachnospiraceae bacterium]